MLPRQQPSTIRGRDRRSEKPTGCPRRIYSRRGVETVQCPRDNIHPPQGAFIPDGAFRQFGAARVNYLRNRSHPTIERRMARLASREVKCREVPSLQRIELTTTRPIPAISRGATDTPLCLRKTGVDFVSREPFYFTPFFPMSTTEQPAERSLTPEEFPFTTPQLMIRYVTDTGKILPRKYTGLSARQQRAVTKTIKHSRNNLLAL